MQKFSSFGREKKNRPKFKIEWLCCDVFIYFGIDVLRVNVALRRFHVTSGRQLKIFPSINVHAFYFRTILSLPSLT